MFKQHHDFKHSTRGISDWLGEKSISSIAFDSLADDSISYLNVHVSQDEVIEYRLVMIELIKYANLAKIISLTQKIGRILLEDEVVVKQAIISHNSSIFKFVLHNVHPEYAFNIEILSFLINNASAEMVEEYCMVGKNLSDVLLNSPKILIPVLDRNDASILAIFAKYNFVDVKEIGEDLLKASIKENKLNISGWLLEQAVSAESESILEKSAIEIGFDDNNLEAIKQIIKLDQHLSAKSKQELQARLEHLLS